KKAWRSTKQAEGRKLDAKVEPRFLPFFGGNWLAFLNQAIEVKGRHRLQALQRLRHVSSEVRNLKRGDVRYHACSLWFASECDLCDTGINLQPTRSSPANDLARGRRVPLYTQGPARRHQWPRHRRELTPASYT